MHRKYGDRVRFLTRLHQGSPSAGRVADGVQREGERLLPAADDERAAPGDRQRFRKALPLRDPALAVDPIENPANAAYAGWPERLYVVDEKGVIVYKGKPGPFGYHPEEVEAWLTEGFKS